MYITSIPNHISDKGDFYTSYNDVDVGIYGNVTTAVVTGQMEHFYILNGDHRKAYAAMKSLDECMNYFIANIDQINFMSEKPNAL